MPCRTTVDCHRDDPPTETLRAAELLSEFTRLQTALAWERWRDAGVTYSRRADGTVRAALLGVAGVGPDEGAALLDLERRLGF
jgi:hypothetical protein